MKIMNRNTLSKAISMGMLHANNPITFAGAPANFDYSQGNNNQQAPLDGQSQQVPNTQGNDNPSKIIPDSQSSSSPDPIGDGKNNNDGQGPSPLDKFAEFFDNSPKDDSKNQNGNGNNSQPPKQPEPTILDATLESFQKAMDKQNFLGEISEEDMTALNEGGEKGIKATLKLINQAASNAAAKASHTSAGITKKGMEMSGSEVQQEMKKLITLNEAKTGVASKNKVLLSPAYAPLVSGIQQQILKKKPDATGEELADLTLQYFELAMPKDTSKDTENSGQEGKVDNGLETFFENI